MMNKTDAKAALYGMLNDLDDRREKRLKASATGRHEPSSAYGGLYDVDEVDDGGRFVERRERSAKGVFVPTADLPDAPADAVEEDEIDLDFPTVVAARTSGPLPAGIRPAVIVRRRAG